VERNFDKLEVGRSYKNRRGDVLKIENYVKNTDFHGCEYRSEYSSFRADGCFYPSGRFCEFDLIELIEDEAKEPEKLIPPVSVKEPEKLIPPAAVEAYGAVADEAPPQFLQSIGGAHRPPAGTNILPNGLNRPAEPINIHEATLRDHMACAVMSSLMSNPANWITNHSDLARKAYQLADAMVSARVSGVEAVA